MIIMLDAVLIAKLVELPPNIATDTALRQAG
jgi:hypothetical protein